MNLYKTVYHALEFAIQLFELRKKYDAGFSYPSAQDMFKAYTNEIFLFDQYYRKFHELADKAELVGWDVLKSLRETVESCYSGWFMEQLSLKWGDFLELETGSMLKKWRIPYIPNQYDFFDRYINPTIKESSRNRLFVIVSDAFRFEAAEELTQKINGKYRLKAELEPMLGVLPDPIHVGGDQYVYDIWISPVTGEDVTRCPWLRKLPNQDKYICRIHDVKPEHCREYPRSRKHALKTGCKGFGG